MRTLAGANIRATTHNPLTGQAEIIGEIILAVGGATPFPHIPHYIRDAVGTHIVLIAGHKGGHLDFAIGGITAGHVKLIAPQIQST